MKKIINVIVISIIAVSMVQAGPVVVSNLLDDPSFTNGTPDATMPTSGNEVWKYNASKERVQLQTSTNTSVVGDSSSFTAPINIFDDVEVVGQPDYDVTKTKLTAITPAFNTADFGLIAVAGLYNQAQVFNSYYIITLGTTNGTYTATSVVTNLFKGASGVEMEENVIAAWNTLTWDVDPFASGGVVYQAITNISIKWFHETVVANTTDAGAWFNMDSATIGYTAFNLGDDLYFDGNGTNAGFGLTNTIYQLDPTNAVWTTDPAGITGHTTLSSGNQVVIETTGPNQVGLHWVADALGNIVIDKLTARYAVGGSGWTRMQQSTLSGPGEVNLSVNTIDNDTVNGSLALILASDITIVTDFEKIGGGDLTYSSGRVKQTGTATISDGAMVIQDISTVDTNSDFILNGGSLLFRNTIDDGGPLTATIGTIGGSGDVSIRYTGDLTNLTVSCMGFGLTNDVATDLITFGWGSSCTLLSDSVTSLDLQVNGVSTTNDYIGIDWATKTLTMGGTLNISLTAGSDALAIGNKFDLFSDNLDGSFSTINLPALSEGYWDTKSLVIDGTISVEPLLGLFLIIR